MKQISVKNISFTRAVRKRRQILWWLSDLIGTLHHTIIWFSLFIAILARQFVHFSPQDVAQWPIKR